MSTAVLVAVLVGAGVYLLLQRGLVRVTFGFVLLGHAANVVLLGAGGMDRRDPPLLAEGSAAQAADPLPQAFALTAIVIAFGITVYLLALAGNGGEHDGPPSDAEGPRAAPPRGGATPLPGGVTFHATPATDGGSPTTTGSATAAGSTTGGDRP
ncbi:cation:proton antiporter [Actinotalea ferrariae CF5-4]|uniref:Cation:proton antiporter n=1 Tax=Actinotalea ferrariae CF5-4 TaxID=948458 RepID=A0A021VUA7_9CELL|nr:cation:proton antiporter subunit C [Actinotalea ferrariae]EYR63630.1 cation:proton antiporter [Actinotalea ferrariae CF5-4]